MMVFVVVESIMIAGVTLYQFNKQNSEYHENRLERKEKNLLMKFGDGKRSQETL